MQTKYIANTFVVFVIIFGIFGGAYFLNEDFRVIVKNLKPGENNIVKVTDDFKLPPAKETQNPEEGNNIGLELNSENKTPEQLDLNIDGIDLSISDKNDESQQNNSKDNLDKQGKKEFLGKKEKDFLEQFKEYHPVRSEIFTALFGILRDFSTKYETFNDENSKITIYFFGKQDYTSIKAYFEDKKEILNMNVNEVNNFGDNSFYLNAPENNTGRTRIILKKGEYVYGLDIDKNEYNNIKTILLSL